LKTEIHPVVYENQSFDKVVSFLKNRRYHHIFILVDENTMEHCLPALMPSLKSFNPEIIEIPSGEEHKTLQTCQIIWNRLLSKQATRNTLLINLGGGVIGDMGGFSASVYKRGIHFINIPTTLLSSVDASVGGKTGVDYRALKNQLGVFANPQIVFIYPGFFKTLKIRQLKSGFAEMLKHGLIANKDYWNELKKINDFFDVNWPLYIESSIQIKSKIVSKDPEEKGLRKLLNFGHTAGHAFESYSLENHDIPLLHGEAVALGIMLEVDLSVKKLGFNIKDAESIKDYLQSIFAIRKFKLKDVEGLFDFMMQDKKNADNGINFTLLKSIGEGVVDQICTQKEIQDCLQSFIQRD
jgi:3-dehydroquinate synthase